MNTQFKKLMHYVLIILLVFTPLRSVFAMQLMVCDMKVESDSATRFAVTQVAAAGVTSSKEHCQHVINNVSATVGQKSLLSNQSASQSSVYPVGHKVDHQVMSCCSDNGACMSDCHLAISASLFIQQIEYSPILLVTGVIENASSAILVRELIPPSKPPQSLYS